MGLDIKTANGKAGYFDAGAFLKDAAPGASVSDYDSQNGILKFKTQDGKDGSFNVKQMLADQGTEITGHKDFNTPVTAADSSPLGWRERMELGLLTHESTDFQTMVDGINSLATGKPVDSNAQNTRVAADDARAVRVLKTRYEDAKVSNGEVVVKQNGVWKKADSSSDSLGADAAHFVGSSGLNIMGAIAGGAYGASMGSVVPGIGTAVGGAIGAVAGGMLGEVAKEATAVGLAGGAIDYEAAGRDLLTNGIMNMAGEVIGAGVSKGVAKITGRTLEDSAASAAVQKESKDAFGAASKSSLSPQEAEAQLLKGFKVVANTADDKVKDGIAGMYSNINSNLSKDSLREAIDSSENMQRAHSYSRIARLGDIEGNTGEQHLVRSMATDLQDSLEGAYSTVKKEFGTIVGKIRNSVSDDFSIDLEQHATDLKAALEEAPRDKRQFFDSLKNETEDLIKSGKTKLSGEEAFDFTQRQYEMIGNKLKAVGANEAQNMAGADDRLLFNAMEKTRSYLDDKRLFAAEHAGLSDAFEAVKKTYGGVKDALDTVWSKSYSNKRDMSFAQNVAKGNVDQNVKEALNVVNRLVPAARVGDTVSSMRLKQAGIEIAPWWSSVPGATTSIPGAAKAVATAATGAFNPGIAIRQARAAAVGLSPIARGAQAVGEGMSKAAIIAKLPEARAQASALLGMAHSAGFIRTMGQVGAKELLTNPKLFDAYVQKSAELSHSLSSTTDEAVMQKAIQMQQQKQGGQ